MEIKKNIWKRGVMFGGALLAGVSLSDFDMGNDSGDLLVGRAHAGDLCARLQASANCGPYKTPSDYGFVPYKGNRHMRTRPVTICMNKKTWSQMDNFARRRGKKAWIGITVVFKNGWSVALNASKGRCKVYNAPVGTGFRAWTECDGKIYSGRVGSKGSKIILRRK